MADLLTHVLAVYVVLTVASWRVAAVTSRWVVVGMCGSAIPDLVKTQLVLDSAVVEAVLGAPFSYAPVSTLGGVLLIAAAIGLAFARRHRRRAYAFLVAGGVISLVLDGLRVYATGRAGPWLYPFTWWRPPTPSLYVTSDPRILVLAIAVAGVVFAVDRKRAEAATGGNRRPTNADP
ncbi:metal-dependent hydrolase [Halosimplex amylolyticum]|uniref:metal-dependent hydrolase n=1 Tax=Halosimplex amylolyticum TaxID=3396616 RepID=UPI003F567675